MNHLIVREENEASTDPVSDGGLWLVPSAGRDTTGCILSAYDERGKLVFKDPASYKLDTLLTEKVYPYDILTYRNKQWCCTNRGDPGTVHINGPTDMRWERHCLIVPKPVSGKVAVDKGHLSGVSGLELTNTPTAHINIGDTITMDSLHGVVTTDRVKHIDEKGLWVKLINKHIQPTSIVVANSSTNSRVGTTIYRHDGYLKVYWHTTGAATLPTKFSFMILNDSCP